MRYNNTDIVQLTYKMDSKDLSEIVKYAPKSFQEAIFNSLAPKAYLSLQKEVEFSTIPRKESLIKFKSFKKKLKEFKSFRNN
jgi:flagellar motor switch protein FliG